MSSSVKATTGVCTSGQHIAREPARACPRGIAQAGLRASEPGDEFGVSLGRWRVVHHDDAFGCQRPGQNRLQAFVQQGRPSRVADDSDGDGHPAGGH
jgi:hypothetical protein